MTTHRPVPGYIGYVACDAGFVYSIRAGNQHGSRAIAPRRLKGHAHYRTGHRYARLYVAGRHRNVAVHVLVALAFLGPRPTTMPDGSRVEVLHENHDPADNRPGNLRYGSQSENAAARWARESGREGPEPEVEPRDWDEGPPEIPYTIDPDLGF